MVRAVSGPVGAVGDGVMIIWSDSRGVMVEDRWLGMDKG